MSNLSKALEGDISMAHERLIAAMERRVPNLPIETKERYFAVLSILVAKLEMPEKSLRDVLSEMMVEAAGHILDEIGGSR
jgi:hypothetical protein